MARIIAISNNKGGVGKTTTSINLAACLAIAEYKVLLIDIDPQGNASSGLNVYEDKIKYNIGPVLFNEININDAILKTDVNNLKILPSDLSLAGIDIELMNADKREFLLKTVLNNVQEDYNYIIIDCPPSLSLLTVNALVAAKTVMIPIQCEYFALQGLSHFLKVIQRIKKNLNPELDLEGVVLTMFDVRTLLSKEVVAEIKSYFKDKVFNTIIPRNVRLGEAPSYGKPIITYDLNSKGAHAYMELAKEVISNVR